MKFKTSILSIFFLFIAVAVNALDVYVGESRQVSVDLHAGNSYNWNVYLDNAALTPANSDDFTIVNGTSNQSSVVFHSAGTYFLIVFESNPEGCFTGRSLEFTVLPNDYKVLFTNSTSSACYSANNTFTIPIQFKDGNGLLLDSTHFPIVVSFKLNGVNQPTQTIAFANQTLNISGGSFTANSNSDTQVVITITDATDVNNLTIQPETSSGQNIHTHTIFREITAPTVVSQTTNDLTPIITGTASVGANETLSVSVNGFAYTPGDGNLVLSGANWTLTIPASRTLAEGTYEITATISNANCNLSDITTNELMIDTTAPIIPTVVSQVTSDTTPIITGTATVASGETLTVTVNGVTYTAGDGKLTLTGTTWTLQIPTGSEILDGTYPVTATVTDPAGNIKTDITTNELIIDTTAPIIPAVVSQVTSDTTPIITGTATVASGETLTVTVNGVTYTEGDGNLTLTGTDWALQIPTGSEILDGTYPVTATVTDPAGNSRTDITTNELIIDTTAPIIPTVVSQVTSDTTPIITGTATVASGETLTVTVNGVTYTAGDGKLTLTGTNWTLQIPTGSEILDGTYPVTATVTDPAGNSKTDITTNELIIDTTAPIIPTVVSQVTSDTTPIITGTATVASGETLTVTVNGVTYTQGDGNLTLTGTGWTLQIPTGNEILEGTYPVTATVTDPAGNSKTDITTNELIIDTTAPIIPTVVSQVTSDTTPIITGTATVASGETLTVTVNGVTYTQGDGNLTLTGTDWALQIPAGKEILDGTYPVTATVTDQAGNSKTDITTNELMIDTTAPVIPTVVSQVTSDTTPIITGTATVAAGEIFTVTVNGVTYTEGDGNLTLTGTDWTLQIPTGSEIFDGTYPVTATVTDLAGNSKTDITTNELIIDTTAPIIPTVVSQVTSDTTPIITGTATVASGEIFTVTVNGVTYSQGDGNLTLTGTDWTLQIPTGNEILDGTYPVTATVTDPAGNIKTDITTNELIIDTTAPIIPTVVSQVTSDTTPIITGTATVASGETLTVIVNGVTYTQGDGKLTLTGTTWTLQIPTGNEIFDGTYPVTATVTDQAGNSSTDITTNELIIDTTAPIIPTVVSQVTSDTTPIITGTATVASGETLTVTVNGVTYTAGDGKLTLTGTDWTLQIPAGSEILDGTYPVTATVTDLAGNSSTDVSTGELIIDTNKPPVALDDAFSTSGSAISGTLATNDNDPEGIQLKYSTIPVSSPTKGTVSINSDGTFIYTPNSDASGTDEFVYEVCDSGTPAQCTQATVVITFNNQPPLAVNDNYSADQDVVINGKMNLNDTDPDGNTLIYSTVPVVQPKHGTVVIHADGTFDFTPDAGYFGNDSFTYEVCDDGIPSLCSEAVVSLQITQIVPVNHAPIAVNDINNTLINTSVSGNILTNDSDPDGDELVLNTKPVIVPLNGKVVISADGSYTYTPDPEFVGEDYFTYSVCDKNTDPVLCSEADVTIEVRDNVVGNRAPVANEDETMVQTGKTVVIHVLSNDFDPDSDSFSITRIPTNVSHGTLVQNTDGTFNYTPAAGFTGTDQFVYEICDNQSPSLCSRATVTIRVIASDTANIAPFAADDAYFTSGDKINGDMSLNDTDPDGNNLVYNTIPLTAPVNGTVVISANGQFVYTPNDSFTGGTDQFVYQVCDDGTPSACDKATVYITYIPKTTPVVDRLATNDVNVTFKNIPVSGNVLINDAGFYGLNSTVSIYLEPQKGTLNMSANGEYTYTPVTDWIGTDNFYYIVCIAEDPAGCDTVNVTIRVLDDNLALIGPVANDDEMQTVINTSVSGNILENDFSPSGDQVSLNLTTKSDPQHGTLSLESDGTFTYTPETGFIGQDYFVYEICGEISGLCANARVTITVSDNVPEMQLFADDDLYFSYGEAVRESMIANDMYPSASTLSVNLTPIINPANGTVAIKSDGTFVYTPISGFVGTDQFVYEICDTSIGECDNATVYIMVKAKPTLFADLSIIKSGPVSSVPGELVDYKLTVTNLGTDAASNVQIFDYLPSDLLDPQYYLEGSSTLKDWSGYYQLDQLEVNSSITIFIRGTISSSAPDTLKNLATVSSATWDPILTNNQSVVKTIINRGPVARIQGAPYIAVGSCNVDGKILDASSSTGNELSFSWSPTTYLDNSASSSPLFKPGKSTRYTLTVTDNKGLQDTISVMVMVMPAPQAVTDGNVFVDAPDASILLNGANSTGAGLTYLWLSDDGIILDGETKTTALVSGLGIYYLQVTDSLGCSDRDSVNVGIYIQAINDTASTKVNESVTINVVKNDIPQNAINPSSISIVTPPLHGIATVLADSLVIYSPETSYTGQDEFIYAICDYFNNCDNAKVLVLINDVPLFAPDAFSPNGDGINDKFVILGLEKYKTVKIEIYNRWGSIVYQANNYGEGEGKSGFWDGTAGAWDGKATTGLRIGSGPVPSGTYYYILTLNGSEKISKSVYLDR